MGLERLDPPIASAVPSDGEPSPSVGGWALSVTRIGSMKIHQRRSLDGGGEAFGWQIIETVKDLNLEPGRAFEWCSGFGYVGFSLLNLGLCDSILLGDINPEAIALCEQTIELNGLKNARAIVSDGTTAISPEERFDLVISNPPHFTEDLETYLKRPGIARHWPVRLFHERIWRDPDWQAHRAFFSSIGAFLNPGATIVICETWAGSRPETFERMIEESGLTMEWRDGEDGFFMLIVRQA